MLSNTTESLLQPSVKITIAIPTMRRWSFLKDSVPAYVARPEVAEVIICDETGEDYELLQAAFGHLQSAKNKLRLYKNEQRLGIYENKKKCLSLATTTWVALLDSDNIFGDDWFEALPYMDFSDEKRIFASADFKSVNVKTGAITYECRKFRGLVLDPRTWNETLEQPKWNFLLNDGNWIVPRSVIDCLPDVRSESLLAADAIFMARCFVKGGYCIYYVPGLEYTHLVHPGSSWLQTDVQSSRILLSTDWRI
jgi:glycosyltransferase involved in cell wall biosynthesis